MKENNQVQKKDIMKGLFTPGQKEKMAFSPVVEESQAKDRELYDLKHDLIHAQIQAETYQQERDELKAKVALLEANIARLLGHN